MILNLDGTKMSLSVINNIQNFWELSNKCELKLLFYLYKQIGEEETARDLLQDTFQKVLTQKKNLNQIKNRKAWIFNIARNTLIDYTRKKKEESQSDFIIPAEENHSISGSLTSCLAQCIYRIIDEYENLDSNILINVFTDLWTQKEAANRLNIPYSTLKSRIQKARKSIAQGANSNCNCNWIKEFILK